MERKKFKNQGGLAARGRASEEKPVPTSVTEQNVATGVSRPSVRSSAQEAKDYADQLRKERGGRVSAHSLYRLDCVKRDGWETKFVNEKTVDNYQARGWRVVTKEDGTPDKRDGGQGMVLVLMELPTEVYQEEYALEQSRITDLDKSTKDIQDMGGKVDVNTKYVDEKDL